MYKKMSWLFLLALVLGSSACFLSSSGSVQPNSPPAPPAGGRLGQINSELAAIEQQIEAKNSERAVCEEQRNASLIEIAKATGMGPKPPQDMFDEELAADPGMLISMHNQNMSLATAEMRRIDSEIHALNQKAANLRNERKTLEQSAKPATSAPADGPGGCFTPDTAVLMERGGKAIVNVAPGETVMVYDETSGRIGYRPVVNVFRFEETHYYLLNQTLRATSLHRFMTDSGWVPVKDLKIGMQLKTAEGWKALESKKLIAAPVAVFNLEVAEHHDFFIDDGTDRYLVHNTGGGGK
jgi:hypothetical protein